MLVVRLLNWAHQSLAFIPPDLLGSPGDEGNPKDGTEARLFSTGREREPGAHHGREGTEHTQLSVPVLVPPEKSQS